MTTAAQEMFDATVRVEKMIYIPGIVADIEATPDDFDEEFCEGLPESLDASLYVQLPLLRQFSGGAEAVEVAEALLFTDGFLVQAATPVFDYDDDDSSSASFSWGHYYTAWLYAPDQASISRVCAEWADGRRDYDRSRKRQNSEAQP
jgi:hypothetical protein